MLFIGATPVQEQVKSLPNLLCIYRKINYTISQKKEKEKQNLKAIRNLRLLLQIQTEKKTVFLVQSKLKRKETKIKQNHNRWKKSKHLSFVCK